MLRNVSAVIAFLESRQNLQRRDSATHTGSIASVRDKRQFNQEGQADMEKESKLEEKAGQGLRCETCGMQIRIEVGCGCKSGDPLFECCGKPLTEF